MRDPGQRGWRSAASLESPWGPRRPAPTRSCRQPGRCLHGRVRRLRLLQAAALIAFASLIVSLPALARLAAWFDRPLADWRGVLIDELAASPDPAATAQEEIARLRTLTAELQRRLAEYEEVGAESEAEVEDVILHRAGIIGRSDRDGSHLIEIDRGAIDRVHKGMAVTVGWSLVGVVVGEQAGRSLVRLTTDPDSRVPAKLLNTAGAVEELGLCVGLGERDHLELRMVEDRPGLHIEAGQFVVTAENTLAVPSDLVLGVVTVAHRQDSGDHWYIELQPLRDSWRQSSVLVLREDYAAVR